MEHADVPELIDSKTLPRLIYHYCPTDAFLNIIKGGQIYLSITKYVNDYLKNK